MKILKDKLNYKNILLMVCGVIVGFVLSNLSIYKKIIIEKVDPTSTPIVEQSGEQKFIKVMKKYTVNIPAKYFDGNTDDFYGTNNKIIKDFFISELPQAIPNDNSIKVINEKFDPKAICGKDFICDISYGQTFDVDGDNKKEQIVSIFRGVNHGVDDKYLVKDGQIIFKSLDEPQDITESDSHNGFYLTYYMNTFLAQPGTITKTRYIHDQGKFIPVWSQTSTELQIANP